MNPPVRLLTGLAAVAVMCAGCGGDRLGPAAPTGAIDIGDPPATSTPPPPPGSDPKHPVPQAQIPGTQQQVQDTLRDYLVRTLRELPPGTVLDATRYGSAGRNSWCEDEPGDPETVPRRFHTTGELKLPAGTDPNAVIRQVGDIWRGWGWNVYERDGFREPNEFGYGPDGYRLQIVTAGANGYPPTVWGSSPCFPAAVARDDIPFPITLRAD